MKKIYIALVCVFISVSVFADNSRTTFRERSENWLKRAPAAEQRPGGTGDTIDTPTPPEVEGQTPIGDAVPLMIALGLTYGLYVFNKKRKTA